MKHSELASLKGGEIKVCPDVRNEGNDSWGLAMMLVAGEVLSKQSCHSLSEREDWTLLSCQINGDFWQELYKEDEIILTVAETPSSTGSLQVLLVVLRPSGTS